jgi:hypothetical protein
MILHRFGFGLLVRTMNSSEYSWNLRILTVGITQFSGAGCLLREERLDGDRSKNLKLHPMRSRLSTENKSSHIIFQ